MRSYSSNNKPRGNSGRSGGHSRHSKKPPNMEIQENNNNKRNQQCILSDGIYHDVNPNPNRNKPSLESVPSTTPPPSLNNNRNQKVNGIANIFDAFTS